MSSLRVISFSELDTAKQCPHKHQLAYIERWTGPRGDMDALSKGTAWHAVMEAHYDALMKRQRDPDYPVSPQEAARRVIASLTDDLAELIEWMYSGYVKMWGLDDHWKILAVEHSAQVRLPTPRGTPSSFSLKMKIDLVVQDRGLGQRIRVVDHKSGKDLPHKKALELDDQFALYTWGLQQLGRKVFGQIYNAARTLRTKAPAALDSRFYREPMYRTPEELEEVAREAYQVARTRYLEQALAVKMGTDAPRHTNTQTCSWRCDYMDACLFGRKTTPAQEREFLRAKGFTQDFSRH